MLDRAATYDKPEGERSMERTVAAFNILAGRIGEAALKEDEGWLLMDCLKTVRDRTGAKPHRDSIEDKIAYAALYGEARLRELPTTDTAQPVAHAAGKEVKLRRTDGSLVHDFVPTYAKTVGNLPVDSNVATALRSLVIAAMEKHSTEAVRTLLKNMAGVGKLNDVPLDLVQPAYDELRDLLDTPAAKTSSRELIPDPRPKSVELETVDGVTIVELSTEDAKTLGDLQADCALVNAFWKNVFASRKIHGMPQTKEQLRNVVGVTEVSEIPLDRLQVTYDELTRLVTKSGQRVELTCVNGNVFSEVATKFETKLGDLPSDSSRIRKELATVANLALSLRGQNAVQKALTDSAYTANAPSITFDKIQAAYDALQGLIRGDNVDSKPATRTIKLLLRTTTHSGKEVGLTEEIPSDIKRIGDIPSPSKIQKTIYDEANRAEFRCTNSRYNDALASGSGIPGLGTVTYTPIDKIQEMFDALVIAT